MPSRLRYNGHNLLLNCYHFRIVRIDNPSYSVIQLPFLISFCTVQPRTFCARRSLTTPFSLCPAFKALWSSAMPLSIGKGQVTTTTNFCVKGEHDSKSCKVSHCKLAFCSNVLHATCATSGVQHDCSTNVS